MLPELPGPPVPPSTRRRNLAASAGGSRRRSRPCTAAVCSSAATCAAVVLRARTAGLLHWKELGTEHLTMEALIQLHIRVRDGPCASTAADSEVTGFQVLHNRSDWTDIERQQQTFRQGPKSAIGTTMHVYGILSDLRVSLING